MCGRCGRLVAGLGRFEGASHLCRDILDCEASPTVTATIAGDQPDPAPANNIAELQVEAEPLPALPAAALVLLVALLAWIASRALRQTHAG